ncbi:hypothetical protein ERHA55_06480 [Erwinia rhapontici]|uniref:Uncharacterized protein n=1 Tax=Erwinia rhapontici TaxID=55212 RepID=A0ABM7MVX7_ERWRD|nr:hypothetical protein ERHA53_05880 [Erwinia rhapontici]BCQ43121.1 hypothetical protein ERHA55_06480 [Erwinia rhapontici]
MAKCFIAETVIIKRRTENNDKYTQSTLNYILFIIFCAALHFLTLFVFPE